MSQDTDKQRDGDIDTQTHAPRAVAIASVHTLHHQSAADEVFVTHAAASFSKSSEKS